ncbi:unnamed protein product [Alopecurus aequalis]
MDATKPQQQQEEQERKASMEMKTVKAFSSKEEADSSSSEDADEPVQNHRGWKAMPYVIGNETFEKLGTIGTLSNMLVYLTTVYHMQSVSAATLLSVFSGTSNLATVAGAFVSDTYLGRYNTLAAATISSFIGMTILTLTAALHSLHPPSCSQAGGEQCQGPSGGQMAALIASFFFLLLQLVIMLSATAPEDTLHADGKTPADPWRLCTMQQVEEVKCLVRIIPVWSSGIVYFLVLTQLSTYTVLQAAHTDRRLGNSGFEIPQGSFVVFNMLTMTLWIPVYDRFLVPALRRVTGRKGGISLLQRIGIGFMLSIVTMVAVSGLSEAFASIGQTEFYYRQFPENMRSVAGALFFVGIALASYGSGLMITVVNGSTSWLEQDLDAGRVDLFYLVTAAMAAVNLVYFLACARWYRFKKLDDDDPVGAGDVNLHEKASANTPLV